MKLTAHPYETQGWPSIPAPIPRSLFLNSEVSQETVGALSQEIITIREQDDYLKKIAAIYNMIYQPADIMLYIDSYGGDVYSCFGLVNLIEDDSSTPIHTIVTGTAQSAAFVIAIHGKRRSCYADSTYMWHPVQLSAPDGLTGADLQEFLDESNRVEQSLIQKLVSRTGADESAFRAPVASRGEVYLTAEDALKHNIVDTIRMRSPVTERPTKKAQKK